MKDSQKTKTKSIYMISLTLCLLGGLSCSLLASLLEEENVDVGLDSSRLNGGVDEELVHLFVGSDGFLDVSRSDPASLVLLAEVASHFHELCNNVLNNRGQSDWGGRADSGGVVAVSEQSPDSSYGEVDSCLG